MSLPSQFQASGPLPSATFAGWDSQTTEQPLWAQSGPGPGPGPAGTIYVASIVTAGGVVGISNVPFTFPAVTEAGTYLIQGGQPIINNDPASASPIGLTWRINGTSPANYNCLLLPGPVAFNIVLTLAVGDVASITLGQTGGASTWAVGGVASISKITLTPP